MIINLHFNMSLMCSGKSHEAVSGCDCNSHFAFVIWKDVRALKKNFTDNQ